MLSGRGLCDELITHPEESYRLWCIVCDLETSRIGAPYIYIYIYIYIYNISCLRVNYLTDTRSRSSIPGSSNKLSILETLRPVPFHGREADRVHSFVVNVKNEWICSFTPPERLHGTHMDNLNVI